MKTNAKMLTTGILLALILAGLPLLGALTAGHSIKQYLEFPPLTRYIEHAPFSWPSFIGLGVIILVVVLPFVARVILTTTRQLPHPPTPPHHFPYWGWAGMLLTATAWVLAWTQFEWFIPFQLFVFCPIWLGYILVINALTYRHTGHCMLRDRPRHFLLLFPVSTVFWWFFEYLNRFVQNWYYQGGDGLTGVRYALIASLHFATVLPAVLGTYEFLESMPRVADGLAKFLKVNIGCTRIVAWVMFSCACVGLAGIAIWPDYLFPLLWLSPLFIITSLQAIQGKNTIFTSVRYGYWRRIYLLALAGLICGFFWEMWNYGSHARWVYLVPFVDKFKIFEMPILGYAGYLPFGLECAVIADLVNGTCRPNGRPGHGLSLWRPISESESQSESQSER